MMSPMKLSIGITNRRVSRISTEIEKLQLALIKAGQVFEPKAVRTTCIVDSEVDRTANMNRRIGPNR